MSMGYIYMGLIRLQIHSCCGMDVKQSDRAVEITFIKATISQRLVVQDDSSLFSHHNVFFLFIDDEEESTHQPTYLSIVDFGSHI